VEIGKQKKIECDFGTFIWVRQEKMREDWKYVYFQCRFYFLFSSKFLFVKILEIKRKI